MNRLFPHRCPGTFIDGSKPLRGPARRLRLEADAMLRDIGYVLALSQRVKDQLANDRKSARAYSGRAE